MEVQESVIILLLTVLFKLFQLFSELLDIKIFLFIYHHVLLICYLDVYLENMDQKILIMKKNISLMVKNL